MSKSYVFSVLLYLLVIVLVALLYVGTGNAQETPGCTHLPCAEDEFYYCPLQWYYADGEWWYTGSGTVDVGCYYEEDKHGHKVEPNTHNDKEHQLKDRVIQAIGGVSWFGS